LVRDASYHPRVKNVWGLGAAVLSLFFIVLFWTVYVTGRLATTERLAPSETADGIEVPVIGTVGDFPEPEHRHVVNVTADGRIVVDGNTLTFDELRGELKRRAAHSRGVALADGKRLSGESVVLRVDGDVGWGAASALLLACAEAEVNRVLFGVRHEPDGDEGAIAVFLPTEGGGEDFGDPSFDQRNVSISSNAGAGTPAALRDHFAALPESKTSKLIVELDADAALPTSTVLATLDAVLRSGAASATLAIGAPPKGDVAFAVLVRSHGKVTPSHEIVITDESWTDATNAARHEHHGRHVLTPESPAPPMPPVARIRGALAGVTAPQSLVHCD
jgi:biopolymer transport protein ExbD